MFFPDRAPEPGLFFSMLMPVGGLRGPADEFLVFPGEGFIARVLFEYVDAGWGRKGAGGLKR